MTTKKNTTETTTSIKLVTLDADDMPRVFAERDDAWFETHRAEVEALEEYAIAVRKTFDRLVEMAKSAGFAQDVTKITKPRGRKSAADHSDPFAFMAK